MAEVIGTPGVAALAHHGVEADGAQRGVLLQRRTDQRHERIDHRESLMRHFLPLALAPPTLAPSVMPAAAKRLLVVCARPPHARAPRLAGARVGTIPLPVITPPAHPQLLLAARTVQQSVAGHAHRLTSCPRQLDSVHRSDK